MNCSRIKPLIYVGCALFVMLHLAKEPAVAQTYPTGPIRLIYPFTAGSGGDIATRVLGAEIEKTLGQSVVVENRPGAGGRLGPNALAQAPGNGHILSVVVNGLMVVLPLADPNYKIEPVKDYMPVTLAFESYGILVGRTGLPYRDMKGLISYAKEHKGQVRIASTGVGSNPHLIVELLKSMAGIEVLHVPYKGETPALTDLMSGQIDLMFTTAGAKPYIDGGRLVGVATTGPRRWSLFPALPTMDEAGLRGLQATTWWGVIAPPGTSTEVIAKLNSAFKSALQKPAVLERFVGLGLESIGSSPSEFSARIDADRGRWGPVIKNAGIKFE